MNNLVLKKNIKTAYLISIPIGFLTVLVVFALPVIITGESLAYFFIIPTFGWAILGLLVSFVFAIAYGSKKAHNKILKGKSMLAASFSFSFSINNIIWLSFFLLTIIKLVYDKYMLSGINPNYDSNGNFIFDISYFLIMPITAYLVSVIGTSLTLGLVISKIFRSNITKLK